MLDMQAIRRFMTPVALLCELGRLADAYHQSGGIFLPRPRSDRSTVPGGQESDVSEKSRAGIFPFKGFRGVRL